MLGQGVYEKSLYLPPQYCCDPKTLLKKSILKTQENSKERVSGGYADLYTPEPKKDLQSSSVLQIRYCQIAKLKLVMDRTVFYFCMYPVHLFNTKK